MCGRTNIYDGKWGGEDGWRGSAVKWVDLKWHDFHVTGYVKSDRYGFCILMAWPKLQILILLCWIPSVIWACVSRAHGYVAGFQSYSTFSSENLSASDDLVEGNTSEHSERGCGLDTGLGKDTGPKGEKGSQATDKDIEREYGDQGAGTPEMILEISSHSDGLSDKESAVRRVRTQICLGQLARGELHAQVHPRDDSGYVGNTDIECQRMT